MKRGWRKRLASSHGASLPEYVVVLALCAFVGVGAINYMQDGARSEAQNQADCISTRPPPPSCQNRAVSTTTTEPDGGGDDGDDDDGGGGPTTTAPTTTAPTTTAPTTTTTAPTTTTTAPTTTTTAPTTGRIDDFSAWKSGGGWNWDASASVELRKSDGTPLVGATVQFRFRPQGGGTRFETCTTGPDGRCTVESSNLSGASYVDVRINQISSNPPVASGVPSAQIRVRE